MFFYTIAHKTQKIANIIRIIIIVTIILLVTMQSGIAFQDKLSDRSDVKDFIEMMSAKYDFNKKSLTKLLNKTKISPEVLEKIQHPYEEEPWYKYREHFLTQERIFKGVKYWREHRTALKYAEQEYEIPASVIVAIIGVETLYGEVELKYPVLNSLVTLSFYYPPRANFFQNELVQYLLLTRELGIDPCAIKGSYAGAIGLPQFMPSSYREYAVPYHSNSHNADLINDTDDVITSIANYLSCFGWYGKQPIAIKAKVHGIKYRKLISDDMKPIYTIKQLKKYGVEPKWHLPNNYPAKLLAFEKDRSNYEYWIDLPNFYVLSHYNANKQYVLAVYQLSEKIKQQHFKQH